MNAPDLWIMVIMSFHEASGGAMKDQEFLFQNIDSVISEFEPSERESLEVFFDYQISRYRDNPEDWDCYLLESDGSRTLFTSMPFGDLSCVEMYKRLKEIIVLQKKTGRAN